MTRVERDAFPGSVDYQPGPASPGLLEVAQALSRWLSVAPAEAIDLGESSAKGTIAALADGWSSGMIRVLAERPLSLTELSATIADLSYPSLERRLTAMRLAGLVERTPTMGRGVPYGPTDWLRSAAAPLTAAVRWERERAAAAGVPVGPQDVEAVFLLALPALRLNPSRSGSCNLSIELGEGDRREVAGVRAGVEQGRVVFCSAGTDGPVAASVTGPAAAWSGALRGRELDGLEFDGEASLGRAILGSLRRYLRDGGSPSISWLNTRIGL